MIKTIIDKIFKKNNPENKVFNKIVEDIGSNYNGLIILNYDTFINCEDKFSNDIYQKVESLRDLDELHKEMNCTQGYKVLDLQETLCKNLENSNDIKIFNFEYQTSFIKNPNKFDCLFVKPSQLDADILFDIPINILLLSNLLSEQYPNSRININFSNYIPFISEDELKNIVSMFKSTTNVKFIINSGINNLTHYHYLIGLIANSFLEANDNKTEFDIKDSFHIQTIAIYRLLNSSGITKVNKDYLNLLNVGTESFDLNEEDMTKRIDMFNNDLLDISVCEKIQEEVNFAFNEYKNVILNKDIDSIHHMLKIIYEYKENCSYLFDLVYDADFLELGFIFAEDHNSIIKLESKHSPIWANTSTSLTVRVQRELKGYTSTLKRKTLSNLINFFIEFNKTSNSPLFSSKYNLQSIRLDKKEESYDNPSIVQFPSGIILFLNELSEFQKYNFNTSDSTAMYAILSNFDSIKLKD